MRGDGCWKCRGELSSNVVTLEEADAVVAIGMDVVMGEDGKLVTTCCDSSGGLGESLLLVELEVFILTVNITATKRKHCYQQKVVEEEFTFAHQTLCLLLQGQM